jgi:hypothetical protein
MLCLNQSRAELFGFYVFITAISRTTSLEAEPKAYCNHQHDQLAFVTNGAMHLDLFTSNHWRLRLLGYTL